MARDDYWTRRALADEAAAERLARQAAKEMRRVYREQYEAVLREIEGLMAEVAEGGTPTRTQLWSYARWRRLEERLREFAGEASRRCEQTVTDCLDEVFRTVIGADVADVTGTVRQASISPKAVLETAWSGEHYSTRIWRNTAAIAQRVRDDVTDMIVQGKGISQVRRRLMEDFSAAYSDADRLVRTEAAYVRSQAALTRYRQNGRRKVRWITGESDGRECSVCRERDGKEYDIDAAPRLPAHPNCRCCYAPVVEEAAETQPDELPQTLESATIQESREPIHFRQFESGDEINEFFYYDGDDRGLLARKRSKHAQWMNSLSEGEKDAICSYTGGGYHDINGYLRKSDDPKLTSVSDVERSIKGLDSAISRYELKDNISVQRGVMENALDDLMKQCEYDTSRLIGKIYQDSAFSSTTVLHGNFVATAKPIVLEMDIPAGIGRGAYVNQLSGQYQNTEYEFLIKRGARFLIRDVREDVDAGKIIVKMVMIDG